MELMELPKMEYLNVTNMTYILWSNMYLIYIYIIYHHISSYIIIYHHISSYIIIYHHISSYIIIYHHISSYIIIYHHISSYIITIGGEVSLQRNRPLTRGCHHSLRTPTFSTVTSFPGFHSMMVASTRAPGPRSSGRGLPRRSPVDPVAGPLLFPLPWSLWHSSPLCMGSLPSHSTPAINDHQR